METGVIKYSRAQRILHWLMAGLIIGLLALGLIMGKIPRADPLHTTLYNLHKSFGVCVLLLAFIRLALRLKRGTPPLPALIPKLERKLAELGHWGFYFFMFALPISGIVMTNSFGFAVPFFGLSLPKIIGIDKERGMMANEAHEIMAYTLIVLICLHVLGALKHLVREKINLFRRML